MKTLGIDIGTTTISAAVLEDGQFLASETRANGAFIPSALTCAREQDVEKSRKPHFLLSKRYLNAIRIFIPLA